MLLKDDDHINDCMIKLSRASQSLKAFLRKHGNSHVIVFNQLMFSNKNLKRNTEILIKPPRYMPNYLNLQLNFKTLRSWNTSIDIN